MVESGVWLDCQHGSRSRSCSPHERLSSPPGLSFPFPFSGGRVFRRKGSVFHLDLKVYCPLNPYVIDSRRNTQPREKCYLAPLRWKPPDYTRCPTEQTKNRRARRPAGRFFKVRRRLLVVGAGRRRRSLRWLGSIRCFGHHGLGGRHLANGEFAAGGVQLDVGTGAQGA